MADAKFSFQEKGKMYHPAWIAPEVNYLLLHHQPLRPNHQHHRHHPHYLLRRCQKAHRTSMCGPRICGAMLFFFGSSPQGKSQILILKYCLSLQMMISIQKAKEKRQLGREVINFGPQTIGQTLASSTRSCFPNTIYSPESSHFHLLAHFLRISDILSIVILFRLKCISSGRSLSET